MASLQVPGRSDEDTDKSSTSEPLSLYCVPCHSDDGDIVEAFGFCQDCQEHLCRSCFKHHRKPKPLAHHVLVDKENMPKSMHGTRDSSARRTLIPCTKHTDKYIEFYCPIHKKVVCYVCSNSDHKQCKTEYIPDVAASYLKNKEFKAHLQRIPALRESCDRVTKSINNKLQIAEENAKTTEEDFKTRKAMIIEVLEQQEGEIKQTTRDFRQQTQQKADTILAPCDEIRTKALEIESKVLQQETDAKFINTVKSMDELDRCEQRVRKPEGETIPTHIAFTVDQAAAGMDEMKNIIGTVTFSPPPDTKTEEAKPINNPLSADTIVQKSSISVKTSQDNNKCWITGMTSISNSSIAIADLANKSIKVVDTDSNKITQTLKVTTGPWDLTSLPDNKLAVTLYNNSSIQLLTTKPHLKVENKLACKEYPRGIDHHQGNLVVSFRSTPHCVEVLSLTGEVLQTVVSGLNFPNYVTVDDDGDILVSDGDNDRVLMLNWTGNVLGTYKHADLKRPRGVAVCGDGTFIVCSRNTNTLHLVSGTCNKVKTLLDESNGIKRLHACLFDQQKHVLYTSTRTESEQDNNIQVFHLK